MGFQDRNRGIEESTRNSSVTKSESESRNRGIEESTRNYISLNYFLDTSTFTFGIIIFMYYYYLLNKKLLLKNRVPQFQGYKGPTASLDRTVDRNRGIEESTRKSISLNSLGHVDTDLLL